MMGPGEYLSAFLEKRQISQSQAAKALKCSKNHVCAIIGGTRRITERLSFRLARCYGMTPEFWYQLQQDQDLEKARALWKKMGNK